MAGTKKHKASSAKIKRTREDGQVANSSTLVRALALVVLIELVIASRDVWGGALARVIRLVVDEVSRGAVGVSVAFGDALLVMAGFGLVLVVPFAVALGSGLWANGFLFAPKALALKFERIDPVANFKGQFGPRGLSNSGLTIAKMATVLTIGALMLHADLDRIASAWRAPTEALPGLVDASLLPLVRVAELVFLVLAVVEFAVQRLMHARELRMDDQEMTRDHKDSNGDPLLKFRLRGMAREIVMEDDAVQGDPDVVLANPTHYAVGLRYRRGVDPVPRVLYKRTDGRARRAIDEASAAGALVVRSPAFTRALFAACETGRPIPSEFVRPIAMVYRLLKELDGAAPAGVVDVQERLLLEAMTRPGAGR